MELGERAWLAREALERARHDLAYLGSLVHVNPERPGEFIPIDLAQTFRWVDAALDGLEPLTIDPNAEPPAAG